MTVVDSSAFIAVLRGEPDARLYAEALQRIDPLRMSAGTLVEIGIVVLHKRDASRLSDMYELINIYRIGIMPVSEAQARDAVQAYARFGKASRHPARLNFGDCFAYALAKSLDAPLLYKGDDFARTDIRSAL